ncbi:MAG TPA: inorganic diphosphatase [Pirellulales bacterium]|nr:inorganic diphosphatase [Pirellulales bacterium]
MAVHPWHDIPLSEDPREWFPAYIEIPRGSNVKYELDKPTGLLRVDRVLFSSVYYPANYGFIPRTYCPDGDPLDVLVIGDVVVPGVIVRARAIGMMQMQDEKGEDDKIVAVHVDDPDFVDIHDINQLAQHRRRELQRFFLDYKILEGKKVIVDAPVGAVHALPVIDDAIELYERNKEMLRDGRLD